MHLTALLLALVGALAASGELAYIDATAGDGGAVFIAGLESEETRQIGPGQQDGPPRWSPDGEWLAFETGTPAGRGIHIVRADGSEGKLVGNGAWCTAPAWSTDGTRLLYCSTTPGGLPGQIRVLDLNSGEDTAWGGGAMGLVQPVWMPFCEMMQLLDPGKPVEVEGVNMPRFLAEARMTLTEVLRETSPEAFMAIRLSPDLSGAQSAVRTELVLVSRSEVLPWLNIADEDRAAGGATLGQVAPNWRKHRFSAAEPASRPFGAYTLEEPGATTRIAFESNEGGDREIMILGSRGVANVSNHRAADWNPIWSPDGDNLAFESFRGGSRGIYNVYADTALVTPIAADAAMNCWSPAWSPDSRQVAFVSDRDGQPEIYIVKPRETEWTSLTRSGGPKAAPAWRPEHP